MKVLDERVGGMGATFNSPATEIAAYRSRLFDRPKDARGFRAAACYAIDAKAEGSHWLWLEDISDAPVCQGRRDNVPLGRSKSGPPVGGAERWEADRRPWGAYDLGDEPAELGAESLRRPLLSLSR